MVISVAGTKCLTALLPEWVVTSGLLRQAHGKGSSCSTGVCAGTNGLAADWTGGTFRMDQFSKEDSDLLDVHTENFDRLCDLVLGDCRHRHDIVLRTESRLKSHRSVRRHLERGKSVASLRDLSGFRIITVYKDDVAPIVESLRDRFPEAEVVPHDKPNGYVSTHLRVVLTPERCVQLGLSRTDREHAFEVQVRSSMQHLWAKLDREFLYEEQAPSDRLRNRFYALAWLAQIFDREMIELRDAAAAERKETAEAVRTGKEVPIPVAIDTILGAIEADGVATRYDEQMIAWREDKQGPVDWDRRWIAATATMLKELSFVDLRAVLKSLDKDQDYAIWLWVYNDRPIVRPNRRPVHRGESLVLYPQYLALQASFERLVEVFEAAGISSPVMFERLRDEVQLPFLRRKRAG